MKEWLGCLYIWTEHIVRDADHLILCTFFQASSCIELLLPATELRHKASLSCVILPQGNKDPVSAVNTNISFVHISPEGIVRFWPNLARVSIFSESNLELDGKDCHQLLNLSVSYWSAQFSCWIIDIIQSFTS